MWFLKHIEKTVTEIRYEGINCDSRMNIIKSNKIEKFHEFSEIVDASICSIVKHNDYVLDSRGVKNDIAILKLCQPVTFGEFIQPVCLPKKQLRPQDFSSELTVVGWGSERDSGPTVAALREVS